MHPIIPLAVAAQIVLGNPGVTALNNGARAIDNNEVAKGVELSREAIDSDTLNPFQKAKAYNNICVGFFKLKLYEEALKNCDTAVSLSSSNWTYYNNRGGVRWGLGQYDAAIADYMKALEFNPKSERVQQNLSLAYKHKMRGIRPPKRLDHGT